MAKPKTYEQVVAAARKKWEKAEAALAKAKQELEDVWASKYKDAGRFYLRRRIKDYTYVNRVYQKIDPPQTTFEMWWEPAKGYKGSFGISTGGDGYSRQEPIEPGIYAVRWRGGRYGGTKETVYTSLEKMMKGTQKFGFPAGLVEKFVQKYNAKDK